MAKNFSNVMDYKVVANNVVKMFNNVDDVVDYVVMMMKKHPNNAVYVNDMGIRLEKELDGKIGVALRDSDMNLIRGYVMGKIKRGMDKAVAYVMDYVVVNNNMNDMEKNMEMIVLTEFNDYVKQMLMNDFEIAIDDAEDSADAFGDEENEHYCSSFDLNDYDVRNLWTDWAVDNINIGRDDAIAFYDANWELFMDVEDMYDFLNNFYGHYIDTEDDGVVLFWVENPNYVEQEQVKNNPPCLDRVA